MVEDNNEVEEFDTDEDFDTDEEIEEEEDDFDSEDSSDEEDSDEEDSDEEDSDDEEGEDKPKRRRGYSDPQPRLHNEDCQRAVAFCVITSASLENDVMYLGRRSSGRSLFAQSMRNMEQTEVTTYGTELTEAEVAEFEHYVRNGYCFFPDVPKDEVPAPGTLAAIAIGGEYYCGMFVAYDTKSKTVVSVPVNFDDTSSFSFVEGTIDRPSATGNKGVDQAVLRSMRAGVPLETLLIISDSDRVSLRAMAVFAQLEIEGLTDISEEECAQLDAADNEEDED